MYIPCPQRGDASSARRSFLSGKSRVGSRRSSVRHRCFHSLATFIYHLSLCLTQKMDKNKDGVVTIDEFIDCCQNVSWVLRHICSQCCWHTHTRCIFSLHCVFVSTGWKHHAINASLWKRSLTWDWAWRLWTAASSSAWSNNWLGVILCTVCYADFWP